MTFLGFKSERLPRQIREKSHRETVKINYEKSDRILVAAATASRTVSIEFCMDIALFNSPAPFVIPVSACPSTLTCVLLG